ncbi:hypothetical protein NEOLI_004035 [Neolecta irregularis DAH-3]|uniref:Uncharacterized protein n=1 Tax=Neolecta irregularis (strain DAH-3) TaxID=1198029 RepID=A0A1U7LKQ9_NEOID|nr:hypothetical protein NEOLI_004035 [Neolecta irregularis DAH-3]|eukprot:OLL23183.1 hypothetical protein NEOLI_004035 [Neolecta irregularis DAH-3]
MPHQPDSDDDTNHPRQSSQVIPSDFSPRMLDLFLKIQKRGLEPLLPASWRIDFPLLSPDLFFPENVQKIIPIRAMNPGDANEFRGRFALDKLQLLGRSVRGRLDRNRFCRSNEQLPVEPTIKLECKRFARWASQDSRIPPPQIPFLSIVSSNCTYTSNFYIGQHQVEYDFCAQKLETKLRKLADAHMRVRQLLNANKAPPTPPREGGLGHFGFASVYGLAICGPRVALVALGTNLPAHNPMRTLVVADFTNSDQDVYNAIAIALLILAARDEEHEWALDREIAHLAGKFNDFCMLDDEDF